MARVAEIALTGSDQLVSGNDCSRLMGWSIRNSHATNAATLDILDSEAAGTGNTLGAIVLAAGTCQTVWLGDDGLTVNLGIYADVGGTGTLVGSVYFA